MDDYVPVSSTSEGQRTVCDILIDKHPIGKPLKPSTVAKSGTCVQASHPVVYEKIDSPHDPLSEPEDGWRCWSLRHRCGRMEAPLVFFPVRIGGTVLSSSHVGKTHQQPVYGTLWSDSRYDM